MNLSFDEARPQHGVEEERIGAGSPEVPGDVQLYSLLIGLAQADEVDIGRPLGHQSWSQSRPADVVLDQDDCDDYDDQDYRDDHDEVMTGPVKMERNPSAPNTNLC